MTGVLNMWCPTTSYPVMNWLKNRPTSSVHLLLDSTWMPTQRWRNRVLVEEVWWRRLALRCLVHVTRESWQIVATSLLKNRFNRVHTFAGTPGSSSQPVGLNGRVRQETQRMRRHHELHPLSRGNRPQRGKSQAKKRKKDITKISQKPHRLSRVPIPRRARTLLVRDATANFTCSTSLRDRSSAAVDGISPEHRVH